MPNAVFSDFSAQVGFRFKAGFLAALFVAPAFGANVISSPSSHTFQGNLPLVDSYVLTITTPIVGWPTTGTTTFTIPLTVTATSFPATSNAATALSYITLSASTLTFNASNQSKSVLVSCNFPSGIPLDSAYAYRIDTSGWPSGINPSPAGASISASLSQPVIPSIAPSVTISSPVNLAQFSANSFPYNVTLSYQATGNGGSDISSEDGTLTGFNPDGSISGSFPLSLTQHAGQTIVDTSLLSIPAGGTYTVQVNVHNGLSASALARFTVTPNGPPPTVTISSPANGSAFTLYANAGVLNIPVVFGGTSSLINITNLVATLDGVPINFTPGGINTLSATGSTFQVFSSIIPSTHSLVVTATDLKGQTSSATSTFTINVFAINWPAPAAISYGSALSAAQLNATASLTGPNGTLPIPGTLTYSPALGTVLSAGTQTLSATFTPADLVNYQVVTQTVPLVVNKVPLTVTAASATKVYGAANPSFSATIGGFVNGDTASVVTGVPSISTSATASSPVGTYAITPGIGNLSASNYTFGGFVAGSLSITKAPLTVTADNKTKTVGAANPTFTATISGFVNGDTTALAVTGTPAFSTTATTASPVGTYPITPSLGGLASTNYSFATFVPGTLTVAGKADQTITFGPLSSVIVGSNPITLTATASSGLAVTYTSSNPAVATVSGNIVTIVAAGTSTITANQAGNANFNAAVPVSQTLTVTAAPACPTTVVWLEPISLNKVRQGGSVLPIKFQVQQCCGTNSRDPDSNGDYHSNDHNGHGDDNNGVDNGEDDDDNHTSRTDDHSGNNIACHHARDGHSTDNRNCRHDCSHDDEGNDGCANLRDQTVIISIYEVGSSAPATQYPYGTGSPNPPDYVIDGDYKYQLNFPTAKGTHVYHIDVYRFPAGSPTPVLVGSKEFSTK